MSDIEYSVITSDVIKSFRCIVFFCLKILFTFKNSVDPDEMQHYAAFHLGLHCLQKYRFEVSQIQRAKESQGISKLCRIFVPRDCFYLTKQCRR